MTVLTSMSSTIIGEPFQLYLSSTLAQKNKHVNREVVWTAYNPDFPGYATVTAQSEGIQIWDLRNAHAVASYSVQKEIRFAIPTFTLCITEDGGKSIVSYAVIGLAPGFPKERRGRTVWIIRQAISGSAVTTSEKTVVDVDFTALQIFGTGHPTIPLLIGSTNGSLLLANAQVKVKRGLPWSGSREYLETFVFPRESCSFVQDDTHSYSHVTITCCRSGMALQVRVVLVGKEMTSVGTCEIPLASSSSGTDTVICGLTFSASGVLSFIDSRGRWATYQLVSVNLTLFSAPISENLQLRRFATLKNKKSKYGLSIVSLGTSLVLLAALVEGTQDISLQVWDLSYGVLLAVQSMRVPLEVPFPHLGLTLADGGQALLTVSPSSMHEKVVAPKRSSMHIIPLDAGLRSNIAAALGKTALGTAWLVPKASDCQWPRGDDESAKVFSNIRTFLDKNNAQRAERAFVKWVESLNSKEAVLDYGFVKKIFNIMLFPDSPSKYPYTPRIMRCLLENAVVSNIMLDGRLITMLRQRGDWENLIFALTVVPDLSEDELVASAKFLIDRQPRRENPMDVDASEAYTPPLWSYLFACVSYPFSVAPMRLAIRKYIPDAQDLVVVLEILENWIQGGTEHEVEALLKSMAKDTEAPTSNANSPPYSKIIVFLQALLDASFVALLQYPPSHGLLRRILYHIEPEITFLDSLEPLRGLLEPFARAQLLKEKPDAYKEGPAERRQRKKQLAEQASLSVGLYRLEELVI